jgi:hypothetical protein
MKTALNSLYRRFTFNHPHSTYLQDMPAKKSQTSFTAVIAKPSRAKSKRRTNLPPPRVEISRGDRASI